MTQKQKTYLSEGPDYTRQTDVFHQVIGKHDAETVLNLADRINTACDQFFSWFAEWEYGFDSVEPGEEYRFSLWAVFREWLTAVQENELYSREHIWLDPERGRELWEQFMRLVPTIYVAVIQECLKDPSKLDYVGPGYQKGKEIKLVRRIESVLPEFSRYDEVDRDNPMATPDEKELGQLLKLIVSPMWPTPNYRPVASDGTMQPLD